MLLVEDSYPNIGINDRMIIQKINHQPDAFINISIVDFAKNVNSAVSTVSKFVRRLGFFNYRHFQNFLTTSFLLEQEKKYTDLVTTINPDEEVEKLKKFESYGIEETTKLLDQHELKKAIYRLCSSDKIWLIGSDHTALQMLDLANNLRLVGCNAFSTITPASHIYELNNLTNNDVVIFMVENYSKQESFYDKLIHDLKINNTTLIMIAARNRAFMGEMDYVLNYFSFPRENVPSVIGNAKIQGFFLNNLIMVYILKLKSHNPKFIKPKQW